MKESNPQISEREDLLVGRNAVTEAIRAGRVLDKVFIAAGGDHALGRLAAQAKAAGAVVVTADRRKLDQLSDHAAHQGVVAFAAAQAYAAIEDMLELARSRGQAPLLVLCDELTDPHNLGAIIRTAECAGAHGVIIPRRRSVGLSAVVAKTSAGAVAYMPVARVANLASTIRELKQQGVWVCGAAAGAETELYQADFTVPTAVIIGNEGAGISRLISELCDYHVSIPLCGRISSLNASAAAAVLVYEAVRQRTGNQLEVAK